MNSRAARTTATPTRGEAAAAAAAATTAAKRLHTTRLARRRGRLLEDRPLTSLLLTSTALATATTTTATATNIRRRRHTRVLGRRSLTLPLLVSRPTVSLRTRTARHSHRANRARTARTPSNSRATEPRLEASTNNTRRPPEASTSSTPLLRRTRPLPMAEATTRRTLGARAARAASPSTARQVPTTTRVMVLTTSFSRVRVDCHGKDCFSKRPAELEALVLWVWSMRRTL
jgi:hypothetical protein